MIITYIHKNRLQLKCNLLDNLLCNVGQLLIIEMTMFMTLSSLWEFTRYIWWIQNCAGWQPTFGPSLSVWPAGPHVGSYSVYTHHRHLITTQLKSWYSFYHHFTQPTNRELGIYTTWHYEYNWREFSFFRFLIISHRTIFKRLLFCQQFPQKNAKRINVIFGSSRHAWNREHFRRHVSNCSTSLSSGCLSGSLLLPFRQPEVAYL